MILGSNAGWICGIFVGLGGVIVDDIVRERVSFMKIGQKGG